MDTVTTLFPVMDFSAGEHQSAEVSLPHIAVGYTVSLARCTLQAPDVWPDGAQKLRVQVELFTGTGWVPWGAFDAFGGIHQKEGIAAPASTMTGELNVHARVRRLRATLIADAPVRTGLTLELHLG